MMIEKFRTYLISARRFSRLTIIAYVRDVLDYQEIVGDVVDSKGVSLYIARLFGLSPATIRRKVAAVRCYAKFMLDGDPAEVGVQVMLPKLAARLPRSISKQSVGDIREALLKFGIRDQLVFLLAYGCGLRVSEIVSLKVDDVEIDHKQLRVLGKGSRTRIVPLSDSICDLVRRYIRSSDGVVPGAYLIGSKSGPLSTRSVQLHIKKLFEVTGLNSSANLYSIHSLRHSSATHLLDSGASIRDVQAFLGHQKLSTTQRYTKVVGSQLRSALLKGHPRY